MIGVRILAKYTDIKHAQIKRARSATKNLNKEARFAFAHWVSSNSQI